MANWHDIFEYDGETLYWKSNNLVKKDFWGLPAGSLSEGYLRFRRHDINYYNHVIIWEMHHGPVPEGFMVDHRDRNKLNNRLENFRLLSHGDNRRNSKVCSNNKLQLKGVYLKGKKYYTQIYVNKKRIYVGRFDTPEEASAAYKAARLKYCGADFV